MTVYRNQCQRSQETNVYEETKKYKRRRGETDWAEGEKETLGCINLWHGWRTNQNYCLCRPVYNFIGVEVVFSCKLMWKSKNEVKFSKLMVISAYDNFLIIRINTFVNDVVWWNFKENYWKTLELMRYLMYFKAFVFLYACVIKYI